MKNPENLLCIPETTNEDLSDYLNDSFDGLKRIYVVMAAMKYGLFDTVRKPKSTEDICRTLKWDEMVGTILIESLESMGFLRKESGKYVNSQVSEDFLVSGSEMCQDHQIGFIFRNIRHWENLQKILEKGQPIVEVGGIFTPEKAKNMANGGRGGSIGMMLRTFDSLIDLSTVGSFLVIGAGSSLYAVAMKHSHPEMNCAVLDRDIFDKVCSKRFKEYGTDVSFINADYKKDGLKGTYDLIFSSLSHACLETEIAGILSHGLNPGGFLVVRRNLPEVAMDPLRDLDINLTRLDVIPKGVRHHHGDENAREYIGNLLENGVALMNRFDYDDRTELLVFMKYRG